MAEVAPAPVFVPAPPEDILCVLRRAAVGDKIAVRWRSLPGAFGENDTSVVEWAGVVQRSWSDDDTCVVVLWDAGLLRFTGRRSCCFPEADPWPDPEFEYSLPVLRRVRAPVGRRVAPPSPPPAVRTTDITNTTSTPAVRITDITNTTSTPLPVVSTPLPQGLRFGSPPLPQPQFPLVGGAPLPQFPPLPHLPPVDQPGVGLLPLAEFQHDHPTTTTTMSQQQFEALLALLGKSHRLDDEEVRELAAGEAGEWLQLCPGLKIPRQTTEETAFLYGPATTANVRAWQDACLRWRIRHSVNFRSITMSNEAENLFTSISEVYPIVRTTKSQWVALLSLIARLLQLYIGASTLSTIPQANAFAQEVEKALASSRTKLDLANLVNEALRDRQNTIPTTPMISTTELNKTIDVAIAKIVKNQPGNGNQQRGKR